MRRVLPLLLSFVSLSLVGCPLGGEDSPPLFWMKPLEGQLSLAGDVAARLNLPMSKVAKQTLVVTLNGDDVTHLFAGRFGTLPSPAGEYELVASVMLNGNLLTATRHYETILVVEADACDGLTEEECLALNAQVADECEIFNSARCLLPYPSSQHSMPAATPTGRQLNISQLAIPVLNGPTQVPASMVNDQADGFSPTVQILAHFPQRVDPIASGFARLLPPCLGQPEDDPECTPTAGPPYVGIRTHDARSLDPGHPIVLLDEQGNRVLHWAETFAGRRLLIIRPGQSLVPDRRYIVGIRNLVANSGDPIVAEPSFAALRDERHTDIPQLLERRKAMEKIFAKLEHAGVPREELVLAFEFHTASDHSLTHQMLAMREQGMAWLDAQPQPSFVVDADPSGPENDCSDPSAKVWKVIKGRYTVPLFLELPPTLDNVGQHTVDADDVPVQNGIWDATQPDGGAPFDISLPCLVHPEYGDPAAPVHGILLGHGIFGTGEGMVQGIPPAAAAMMDWFRAPPAGSGIPPRDTREWNYVAFATDWSGWSSSDFPWVGGGIIGINVSQLHNFPAFPDRHRQGQLNTLILSRMMKRGHFNSHPAFQDDQGNPLLPVPEDDPALGHYYYGISMGGVQGLFHSALSQDIEKFGIDVGSINFSGLLQRSTQFSNPDNLLDFRFVLGSIGLQSNLDLLIGITLLHEVWVSADPAGYATHITDPANTLPGNDFAKKILMTPAWLDYQVSNQMAEITTRTLGIPSGPGSLQKELVGIPDAPDGPGLDSAHIMWDTGLHDVLDPAEQSHIPPLAARVVDDPEGDPHGARPLIPATIQTLMEFLQPGGQIENFCDDNGTCDASQAWECEPDFVGGAIVPCVPECWALILDACTARPDCAWNIASETCHETP